MLTLNDRRNELWQWDTGRKLTVDADCSQVHFGNKVFGRSIDVDVVDGIAIIPDILLQTDKELTAWAFVGTPENGYTKISKVFKVKRRNKPADYVFTPPEQTTLGQIMERLDDLEAQIADCVVAFSKVDGEWKSDKTFNEVRAAYNEGRTLVGMYSGLRYDFYSDGGGEGFGFIFRVTSSLDYEMIWLLEGDSVQFSSDVINVNFPVLSVNGKTGAVKLTAEDVGALPNDTVIPTVPTKVSAFANDKGYQTALEVNALINTALGVIENGYY